MLLSIVARSTGKVIHNEEIIFVTNGFEDFIGTRVPDMTSAAFEIDIVRNHIGVNRLMSDFPAYTKTHLLLKKQVKEAGYWYVESVSIDYKNYLTTEEVEKYIAANPIKPAYLSQSGVVIIDEPHLLWKARET